MDMDLHMHMHAQVYGMEFYITFEGSFSNPLQFSMDNTCGMLCPTTATFSTDGESALATEPDVRWLFFS